MPTIKELQDKRAKAIKSARDLRDKIEKEGRALTTEERTSVDSWLKEERDTKGQIDELTSDRDRFARLDEAESELEESRGRKTEDDNPPEDPERGSDPQNGPPQRRGRENPTQAREMSWRTRGGDVRRVPLDSRFASPDYRRQYGDFLRTGAISELVARNGRSEKEARDLQADSGIDGGFLVAPTQMVGGMIKAVDDLVFIRGMATVHPVTSAQNLGAVSLDADPDDGEWTSEITTGSADTAMKFGRRELNPTPLSKEAKISRKLLRLSPSVESLVLQRLAYKFAITQEKNFLTGDGANKPLGVFTAHANGVPTTRDISTGNTTTALTADGLIRAKMSLKAQYRNGGKASWLFHRDAVTQIALLKDGNGQYIWRQGLVAGEPDRLLNIPLNESEYAPNTFTTGLYVGMLADWSFYWIAEALSMEVQRLNELYAKTNQVGFIARMELDGMPVLAEAFTRIKLA